jgi:acyl-CoA synthetase (AMP-forming)/AMP-acid ligase II
MGAEVTREKVRAFCEGKIARFKVPHYVWPMDVFPLTGMQHRSPLSLEDKLRSNTKPLPEHGFSRK